MSNIGSMTNVFIERASLQQAGPCLVVGGLTMFAPLIEGGTTQAPVTVIRLVLLSALGYWLISGLRVSALSIPLTALWRPLAAFSCLAGLSLLWSAYTNVSLQWLMSILSYAVFFGIVLQAMDSTKRVRSVLILVLAMGAFEGGVGIVQYLWLGEARANGTFFNPNFFATYEAVSAVLAMSLLLWGGEFRRKEKLFLVVAAAISCMAVLLAQSRGGMAAFLLAITLVGLIRYGKAALIVLLVLVVGGIIIPNPLKDRMIAVSKYDPYAYTRIEMWGNAFDRIADHPMGIGLGMYKYSSFQYRFPIEGAIVRYGKRAESAHNEYLQLTVELGVAGLAIFLAGIGIWTYEAKRLITGALSRLDRGMAVGCCAGVLTILAHAGVDAVFHEPALVLLLIVLGGIVLSLGGLVGHARREEWRLPLPYHPARAALLAVAIAGLAALVIRPAGAWFLVEQGNKALTNDKNLVAIQWYRYASFIDPGATPMRDGLARFYVQQFILSGDPEWLRQAADEMEVAMSLNPLDGRAPYRLARIYLLLAEQPRSAAHRDPLIIQAAQALENSITVDHFSPFGYVELSKIRRGQGDLLTARQLLEQAIAYEPNFIPARVALADLAKEIGQTEVADAHLAKIHDIRSKYQGWKLTPLEQQFLGMQSPNS